MENSSLDPSEHPRLLPHAAFVVQLADGTVDGRIVGRAEHVVSGAAVRFDSAEQLLAFLIRNATAGQTPTTPSRRLA